MRGTRIRWPADRRKSPDPGLDRNMDAGAGSTTSRTARCRGGPCNTSAPATGVRAGAGSWRWRAGCRGRRPVEGAGVGGGGHRTPDTEHPGGPTGPSGNPGRACDRRGAWFAASRGTVHPDGSPPSRNVAPPERGALVTGPAQAGGPNRTGVWTRRRVSGAPWKATFRLENPRAAPGRPREETDRCDTS